MRGPGSRPSLLFQLVVPATAVFIITILSLIAVLFSDERAPLAQWLNKNGNLLLLAELVVVVVLVFAAMAVDRMQTLKSIKDSGGLQQAASTIKNEAQGNANPSRPDEAALTSIALTSAARPQTTNSGESEAAVTETSMRNHVPSPDTQSQKTEGPDV